MGLLTGLLGRSKEAGVLGTPRYADGNKVWTECRDGVPGQTSLTFGNMELKVQDYNALTRRYNVRVMNVPSWATYRIGDVFGIGEGDLTREPVLADG